MRAEGIYAFTADGVAATDLVVMMGADIIAVFNVPNIARKRLESSGAPYFIAAELPEELRAKVAQFKQSRMDELVPSTWPKEQPITRRIQ